MTTTDDVQGSAPAPLDGPVRLLVVDADRRVRSSLADLLELADQVDVVGSAGHARAAFDACEACRPDVVIIDPRLPELPDGIAFIRRLREEQPHVRVIAIAWAPGLGSLLGDDEGIHVVAPDGGELGDRILDALRGTPGGQDGAPGGQDGAPGGQDGAPGADARLAPTA